jgi:RND family efflux transporter MFP subunit
VLLNTLLLAVCAFLPQPVCAELYSISGFTEAIKDSTLGVAVNGRVAKVLVRAGDSVNRGQVLIELDQQQEKLETERRKLLWENKTELNAISRQLQTLQAHLQTSRELYRTSASISQEELENQELEEALARIEQQRLQIAEEREQLEYKIAQQQLINKTVKAPFSGKIVDVLVASGENCDSDTPLLRIVNSKRLEFVASVELAVSQLLELGQEVELLFEARQKPLQLKGKISFISPVVDPASGLRKIKASFTNQELAVTAGEPGTMQLETAAL